MREVLQKIVSASGMRLLKSTSVSARSGGRGGARIEWPSGRGDEIGVVLGTPDKLSAIAHQNRQRIPMSANLEIADVFETGARAVVLRGLDRGPVCLTMEPELASDRLAIIADSGSDPQPILQQLRLLFGQSQVIAA